MSTAWRAEGIPKGPSISAPSVECGDGQGARQSEVEIDLKLSLE